MGLAAIIGCGVFVWRSRKNSSNAIQQPIAHASGDSYTPDDKTTVGQVHDFRPKEQPKYTMGPAELSSDNKKEPLELQGDFPGRPY